MTNSIKMLSKPSKSLRIGIVCDDSLDFPDGVQQYMLTVGNWLTTQGHEVYYLVANTQRKDIDHIVSLGKYLGLRFNHNRVRIPLPIAKKKIRQVLSDLKLDVLHIQMPYSPMLAEKIILQAPDKTAIVGTFHIMPIGKMQSYGTVVLRLLLRRSLNRFNQIMSVSEPARKFAKKTFKIDSTVVPNAVTLPLITFDPVKRSEITFLGRLVERKGCETFLQALYEMKKRGTLPVSIRCNVAGKGKLEEKLKRYVMQSGFKEVVTFHGYVSENEKYQLLARSQIAVFPSRGGESFGIVLTEAMATGALVLAGDNPGYRSVMGEDSGCLFNPHDYKQLADKIEFYLQASNNKNEVDRQNKRLRQFTIDAVGPQIINTYYAALNTAL